MSIARDRADRKGTTPIQIGNTKLTTDSSDNLSIGNASGTPKKLIASELEIGDSSNKVIIKKGSDNKIAFQTQASGGSATDSNAGGGVTVYANTAALQAASGTSEGDLGFVTATKKLMLRTSTGWYFVATVTNATPVISGAGNDSYSFALDGTPVVIDVAATDADGETLTYAYQVTAGSLGSTATVVQGSGANVNRFTITPSTNSAHAGSFTLKFSATDPNSNIALSDGSTFTLSFATSGSLYFDGAGDFIHHASSSDFTMGTGNFTLEFWINWATDDLSSNEYIISLGGNGIRVSNNAGVINCFGSGSDKLTFTPTTAEKTGWHHIALVRNGTTNTVYYDGQSKVSATNSSWNHTSTTMVIGQYDNTSINGGYTWGPGYLSNIRIVKGTAVYTSNFTPSTAPLTAVSGTVYLIASNTVPITITNGSTLYTGSGVQVTTPASSDFTLGTGDFTVEGWFNWGNLPGTTKYILDFGSNGYVMQFQSNTQIGFWNGDNGYVQGSYTFVTNTWYHIAWTRVSGTGKCYVNGVQVASGTVNKDISTNTLTMNGYGGGSSYGQSGVKHSDFRVVKGKAVYTGNFSPPTGFLTKTGGTYPNSTNRSDPSASQTVLLTHQDNSGSTVPTDNSDSNHTLTKIGAITKGAGYEKVTSDTSNSAHALTLAGDTAYSYATPFSNGTGGSVYFNTSTADRITTASHSDFSMGTGAFTIECWYQAKFATTGSSSKFLFDLGSNGIKCTHKDGLIRLKLGSESQITYYVGDLSQNAWNHVAACRDSSGNVNLFHNGRLAASYSGSTYNHTSTVATIADHGGTNYYWGPGYISNFRIIKGTDIYSSTLSGAGGLQFTGSGVTSTASHSGFDFGSDNFTVEFWYKWADSSDYDTLIDQYYYSSSQFLLQANTNSTKWGVFLNGSQAGSYESSNATIGAWYHYALVRNGSTLKMYRNGEETMTTSISGSKGGTGVTYFSHTSHSASGAVSNLRVVKGTALYTSEYFTLPSSPLTAISGTALLLFKESSGSTLSDGSTNNVTITRNSSHNILTNDGGYRKFTVPTAQLSNVTNTKLLTCNDSNIINDASSGNHALTLNGYPLPNKFIPFS